jgi:GT2 family glycosyltransferase
MSSPHIVIVVLNWNGREDTLACLRSLAPVRSDHVEVMVVDNGSVDGSEAAIRDAHPELAFVQTGANLGFAGGNNVGIEHALARGAEAVLLLNNDTEVEPDFLTPMIETLDADPRVGIVGAAIAYHHDPERLWAFGGGRFDVSNGWVRHVQRPVPLETLTTRGNVHFYVTGCAMLLRRETIEEVGVLDTSYFHFCEDVDLCLRAERAGWKVTVAPQARLRHKVSATTGVSSPAFLYYNLRSRLTLARRHGPPGSPSRWGVAKLWLRLWRPAVQSGMARTGWIALARAHRDFLAHATGPAPADLVRRRSENS